MSNLQSNQNDFTFSNSSKSNILEKTLFDYLIVNTKHKDKTTFLDDTNLKKINSIVSNLPFEVIKDTYEKVSFENLISRKNLPKNKKHHSKSTSKLKSNSFVRRKQNQNENTSKNSKGSKQKHSDSIENKELSSSFNKSTSKTHKRPSSSQSNSFSSQSYNYFSNPSNQIVIHVCDEAKRLKQDFTCPRDLLITEMKYFSYNLNINVSNSSHNASGAHAHSSVSQTALSKKTLDEIDISVHCDINIFDWLMRYVKRSHPYLIEKNIASLNNSEMLSETNNYISYGPDLTPKYVEPKLDFNNCVSILLSSDFLLMGDLVDKCILFIAKNLDSVLQVPCVMSGISEPLLVKLAACVNVNKLNDAYDRKDKLKTKLFQRKLEFMFDIEKYKEAFENSNVLNDWKNNRFENLKSLEVNQEPDDKEEDNYVTYLYEIENDASTLFKCKLCSRLMTKKQSLNLKCQLAVLSKHGDYVYLHVPDEKLDLTRLLQLLREKLKSWQNVYWFVWSLTKSFKCKKCNEWFRLVEINKCRLNNNTYCEVHDITKNIQNSTSSTSQISSSATCSCIHSDHVLDYQSASIMFSKSLIVTEASPFESPELRLNKFVQFITETFEKNRDIIVNGIENQEENTNRSELPTTFCDMIENILKTEYQGKDSNTIAKNIAKSIPVSSHLNLIESYFVDSITGKHICLINKNSLNLIKLSQITTNSQNSAENQAITTTNANPNSNSNLNNFIYNTNNSSLDLKWYLMLINRIEPINLMNSLEVFNWLRVEPKMRWDIGKPTRLNQDNQREDDLKRFREISSYLIKTKLMSESLKTNSQKSPIAITLLNNHNHNSNTNNLNNFVGGIYCRVENEWKQRSFP